MKRFILLFALLFAGILWADAQDIITTKKGEDIKAKVVEVGMDEVRYIKADNPDGPVYVIRRSDLLIIRYNNGDKDIFYNDNPAAEEAEPEAETFSVFYKEKRYRELRGQYRPRDYYRRPDDPYSPSSAGVASALIPGLGQCITGEFGRGAAFFVGNIMLGMAATANTAALSEGYYYDGQGIKHYETYYNDTAAVCLGLAYVGLYVWNIVDAVRIAKVKNLYHQDMNRRQASLRINVEPYLNFSPATQLATAQPVGGLSFKIDF